VTNVYFYPDIYSEEDDLFKVIGKPKLAYYVEANEIEKFLVDYLRVQNIFPIYLTLTTYNDYADIETLLKKLKQEYQIRLLANISLTSTEEGGMLKYNIPIINVKITDSKALEVIISNTFWMAESNCTYIFSFTENVSFNNRIGKDWRGKDAEISTILIDMSKETTTIGITHDGNGLYLFSNLEESMSMKTIANQLPKYTILPAE